MVSQQKNIATIKRSIERALRHSLPAWIQSNWYPRFRNVLATAILIPPHDFTRQGISALLFQAKRAFLYWQRAFLQFFQPRIQWRIAMC